MNSNLTERTDLNAIISTIDQAATIVVGLVASPIILSLLGSSTFGIWKICQRLLTFVSVADGRATQALKWTIANKLTSDDVKAKRRDIGCAIIVWLRFFPILLIGGTIIAWFSPHIIGDLQSQYFVIVRWTCVILVLNLILVPIRAIPEAVMIGMNRGYRCTWINSVTIVLGGVFTSAAAYIGWGLTGLAVGVLCASIIGSLSILFVARKTITWLSPIWPCKAEVSKFLSYSMWVLAWTFINKLMLSTDIIILGLVASSTKVTSFVFTSTQCR